MNVSHAAVPQLAEHAKMRGQRDHLLDDLLGRGLVISADRDRLDHGDGPGLVGGWVRRTHGHPPCLRARLPLYPTRRAMSASVQGRAGLCDAAHSANLAMREIARRNNPPDWCLGGITSVCCPSHEAGRLRSGRLASTALEVSRRPLPSRRSSRPSRKTRTSSGCSSTKPAWPRASATPNVVEILELGEEGALLYLVMEYVEGEQLLLIIDALRKRGPMPVALGRQDRDGRLRRLARPPTSSRKTAAPWSSCTATSRRRTS